MVRGIIVVGATLIALIALVVCVVGAGMHRIAADQRRADESWHRPDPVPATLPTPSPTTDPAGPATVAAAEVPAQPQRDTIDLDPRNAIPHGGVQLVDREIHAPASLADLTVDPTRAPKNRERLLMRGNQEVSYLTGFRTADDFAEWQIDVPKTADYQVTITYACPKWQECGTFTLTVGDKELSLSPEPTHSESSFRVVEVGRMTLTAGKNTLRLCPAPVSIKSHSYLNLRAVQLIAMP